MVGRSRGRARTANLTTTSPNPLPALAAPPGGFRRGSFRVAHYTPAASGVVMRGSVRVAIQCAPTSLRHRPPSPREFEGESRSLRRDRALLRPLSSPAKVVKTLLQPKVAGVFFHFPPFSRVVPLSVAFATSLEIPSPMQHSRHPISNWRVCVVVLQGSASRPLPSVGTARSTGARSLLRRDRPVDGFQGSREATPFLSSRPAGLLLGRRPRCGLASQRNGCSRRGRAHSASLRERVPPSWAAASASPSPVGGLPVPTLRSGFPLLHGCPVGAVRFT